MNGEDVDLILQGVNAYLKRLAVCQIELAFAQAQKEVDDLHQRTAEGIETARRNGKRIGTPQGAVLNVKKKSPAMKVIRENSVRFGGTLNDSQWAVSFRMHYLIPCRTGTGKCIADVVDQDILSIFNGYEFICVDISK